MTPGQLATLKNDIEAELTIAAAWTGKFAGGALDHVEAGQVEFWANRVSRDLIQNMGANHGCHTCGQLIQNTSQTYIVDHIPPIHVQHRLKKKFAFFPHCDRCAGQQSASVKDVDKKVRETMQGYLLAKPKAGAGRAASAAGAIAEMQGRLNNIRRFLRSKKLPPKEIASLAGGTDTFILGSLRISDDQRAAVQVLGGVTGCHCCRTKQPMSVYHADHCPPREFAQTAWFPKLADKLGIALPKVAFRPQCPSCSHAQGSRCRSITTRATEAAKHFGIVMYKD